MYLKKIKIEKLISYYYKIVTLQTGYPLKNLFFNLLVILLGIITIFLRVDVFNYLSSYPNLLKLILLSGIWFSLFLFVNTLTRITTVLFKGIPFFIGAIKVNKK